MNDRKQDFKRACAQVAKQAAADGLTNKEALDALAQILCQLASFYGVSRESLLENVGMFFDEEQGMRNKAQAN